jgi:hypothetical protein
MLTVYFFASARLPHIKGDVEHLSGYRSLSNSCACLDVPRVPMIGESVAVFMEIRRDGTVEQSVETTFKVYDVETVIATKSDPDFDHVAFRVFMRTDDLYDEVIKLSFPVEMK